MKTETQNGDPRPINGRFVITKRARAKIHVPPEWSLSLRVPRKFLRVPPPQPPHLHYFRNIFLYTRRYQMEKFSPIRVTGFSSRIFVHLSKLCSVGCRVPTKAILTSIKLDIKGGQTANRTQIKKILSHFTKIRDGVTLP